MRQGKVNPDASWETWAVFTSNPDGSEVRYIGLFHEDVAHEQAEIQVETAVPVARVAWIVNPLEDGELIAAEEGEPS